MSEFLCATHLFTSPADILQQHVTVNVTAHLNTNALYTHKFQTTADNITTIGMKEALYILLNTAKHFSIGQRKV